MSANATPPIGSFRALWRGGIRAPVWREVLADFETPLSAFAKIDRGGKGFLLESVEGGEVWGRYSIFAADVRETLTVVESGTTSIATWSGRGFSKTTTATDPLGALREVLALRGMDGRAAPDGDARAFAPPPPFRGGAVGWMGYDAVRHYAPVAIPPGKGAEAVEAVFLLPETWLVFDRLRSRITIVADTAGSGGAADVAWKAAVARLDRVEKLLAKPLRRKKSKPVRFRPGPFDVTDAKYAANVDRAKEYITAGDVIQVVLSRRKEGTFGGDPLDVYRALRLVNPSPYMFFLRTGDRTLAGSSPEALVRVQGGHLTTRPIAGTRPRSADPVEDERRAIELVADEKEKAEHLMLVDLGRNDLGRVAKTGSVKVPSFMRVERYSHVMHLVSDVTAELGDGKDAFDAVASVFPAGTLSGAPKIRAMQIVSELEGRRRGFYGGLVGWFGRDGDADTCIAIRTVELTKGRYRVQAGAGLVYDSVGLSEAAETTAKAEAVLRSLSLAAEGL